MKCPKCDGKLERKTQDNITLDRCSSCYGLLITPEMLNEMLITRSAEKIMDIGSPILGKKYDEIDDIECPVCARKMDKIVDPLQPHIWMEECPKCLRLFLDAGEFSDLKDESFADKFKPLLKGRRKT